MKSTNPIIHKILIFTLSIISTGALSILTSIAPQKAYAANYNISGVVFDDINANGVQDIGENGIKGVTVRAWFDSDDNTVLESSIDTIYAGDTTDSNGNFIISVNEESNYFLDVYDSLNNLAAKTLTTSNDLQYINVSTEDVSASPFGYSENKQSLGDLQNLSVKIGVDTPNGPFFAAENSYYGTAVTSIGDLDGDGVSEIVVGSMGDTVSGFTQVGSIFIHFMNSDGSIKSTIRHSIDSANGPTNMSGWEYYGASVASLGDLDGDGVQDIAVGAPYYFFDSPGIVFIHFLNQDGSIKYTQKIGYSTPNGPYGGNSGDRYGMSVACLGDFDNDGVSDIAVGASRDEITLSNAGVVFIHLLNADGTVKATINKIGAESTNGPVGLNIGDQYGYSVANIGDLNGDGITDIAVGAISDEKSGGEDGEGAVHIHFLDSDGTIKLPSVKIDESLENIPDTLNTQDYFGSGITKINDLDGDGVDELLVGAYGEEMDGGSSNKGVAYLLYMNSDGSIKSPAIPIGELTPNGPSELVLTSRYGGSVASLGDLNGDGVEDIIIGAWGDTYDDDYGTYGAVHLHFLDEHVTVFTYTLNYVAGSGGSISGTNPQHVEPGNDGTEVTAVPDTGYHFTSWSDGVLTASRTDTNINADLTVTANFEINSYTLTYTAGANGTISGTSPQTVNHGSSGTEVTAEADAGFAFLDWSDGVLTASRTDTNVTGDIDVTANFVEFSPPVIDDPHEKVTEVYPNYSYFYYFEGVVRDNIQVASVESRINVDGVESPWSYCDADDGDFDSDYEPYYCVYPAFEFDSTKNYLVQIRATDNYGQVVPDNQFFEFEIRAVDAYSDFTSPIFHLNFEDIDNLPDTSEHTYNGYWGEGLLTSEEDGIIGKSANISDAKIYYMDENKLYSMSADASKPISMEAWVKSDDFSVEGYKTVSSKMNNSYSGSQWAFGISKQYVFCTLFSQQGEKSVNSINFNSDRRLLDGQWNKISCSWDGENLSVAIGDMEVGRQRFTGITFLESSADLMIGVREPSFDFYDGLVDEIKIFNSYQNFTEYDGAPVITIDPKEDAYNIDNSRPVFTGSIIDVNGVVSAEYRFNFEPNTEWKAFTPIDGSWGDNSENFSITPLIDIADGGYKEILIRSCDSFDNCSIEPGGYSSDNFIASYRFSVNAKDETGPRVDLNDVLPYYTSDKTPVVHGFAIDSDNDLQTPIQAVYYQIDGMGEWIPVLPHDGSYDSPVEEFFIQLPELDFGYHYVEVYAEDSSPYSPASYNAYVDFEIEIAPNNILPEKITKEETFDTYDNYDYVMSTGIWSDGVIKLGETIIYDTPVNELFTNPDQMGYRYGNSYLAIVKSSSSDNLWLLFEDGSFGYFNTVTKSFTDYGKPRGGSKVSSVVEFEYGGSTFLSLGFYTNVSSVMYDTNGTLENTSDDTYVDWETQMSNNIAFTPVAIDMRSGVPAIIAKQNQGSIYGVPSGVASRIDTKGTIMDLSDDTMTHWTLAKGVTHTDITALYFDPTENFTILGYYNNPSPWAGATVCDDKGTLNDESDDICRDIYVGPQRVFSIEKDRFGSYLFGGEYVFRVELTNLSSPDMFSRTEASSILTSLDLAPGEETKKVQYIQRDSPRSDEVLVTGRQGGIYRILYNNTSDREDDQIFRYELPTELYSSYSGFDSELSVDGTMWIIKQNAGLFRVDYEMDYRDSDEIYILASAPMGKQEINHIAFSLIQGDYTPDQIEIFVSNNNGMTWYPISLYQIVSFPTSDYQLKVKVVMHKGSTPVIDTLRFAYAEYPEPSIIDSDLLLSYPTQVNQGVVFNAGIDFVDQLGLTPMWNGTVYIDLVPKASGSVKSCVSYPTSVTVSNGNGVFSPKGLCGGTFAFVAWTDDGHIGNGSDFKVLGASTDIPVIPDDPNPDDPIGFCGDGVIDEGEQCDGTVGSDFACSDFGDFTGGELRCSATCQIDTSMCVSTTTTQAVCGNGVIEPGEQCDGSDVRMQCTDFTGYSGGQLSCNNQCQFDMTQCVYGQSFLESVNEFGVTMGGRILLVLTPIVSVLASVLLLNISMFQLVSGFMSIWFNLLAWLGIRKKGQPFGVVYNSITKEPVNGAIVRIFDTENRIVQTQVTDIYGIFNAYLEKGKYRIVVSIAGYVFPSRLITTSVDYHYTNVYTDGLIENQNRGELVVSIPVDPLNRNIISSAKTVLINNLADLVKSFQTILFAVALFISIVVFSFDQSLLNTVILLLYVPSLIAVLVTLFTPVMRLGKVVDVASRQPKTNLPLELKENQYERVVAYRVTDPDGLYRFIVHPGNYSLNSGVGDVIIDDRKFNRLDRIVVEKKPSVIAMDLKAKKKGEGN